MRLTHVARTRLLAFGLALHLNASEQLRKVECAAGVTNVSEGSLSVGRR